ncbi:PEPxxWA-CTERM sorting domain-containing protein [Porphyrobacter algicida]|uniref:PEPxxWA-CTERM sorting domain-containing protein n=1 Tax=Qipengyuania algicida TaxID=1836209 RepID=A0A845AP82_9SPHN|nr:PEPxxWA-CTERM sorting domain-containing protein [Qipengyuania algicida]MXP28768.1 PEPxxWA-CTERM sorting domain-containing protein [Qipengyuania algicida]
MRYLLPTIVAAAALSAAVPASAGQILFDNGGANYQPSKSFTDGTVNVKVSAFSINNKAKVETAKLGSWSGNGMGVLNNANDGSHTIDNQGYTDFVILAFDQSVTLDKALFKTGYYGGSDYYNDTDATIGFIDLAGFNWASDISYISGTSASDLSSYFSTYASNSNGNGSQSRDINSVGNTANVWLIGAAFSNPDSKRDGFKIKSLTYSVPETAVPEPAAWALMILGFGMVGGMLRRKRPTTTLTYA